MVNITGLLTNINSTTVLGHGIYKHPAGCHDTACTLIIRWIEISDIDLEYHINIDPEHDDFHIGFVKDPSSLV